MADLALIDAATTSGCCTHEAQADCCEPEAKQDCCGEADDGECGCAQDRDGNGGPAREHRVAGAQGAAERES